MGIYRILPTMVGSSSKDRDRGSDKGNDKGKGKGKA